MKEPNRNDNPWRAAGLVGAMGADLVVCTLGGYYLGNYIGSRSGAETFWMITGLLVGLAVGVISIIFLIKYYTEG
ncbi:AtpZ/AtpI family protein [Paenibacillus psychroresistens]|nr:AtpZ/AtpI family protein [Paenibacillus psychroresistens]